jgi:hydrogenase maturation protein HypF
LKPKTQTTITKIGNISHCRIVIKGTVQGVGFRPFVYRLAGVHKITGSVLNSSHGVIIEAEGEEREVNAFIHEIKEHPPALSEINDFETTKLPPAGYISFEILKSNPDQSNEVLIPPDVGTCPACAREILDPNDRHYQYPFTNCTNCGPRFTIIEEVPYDRPGTSMKTFGMCNDCTNEYNNPLDRRFHAQPVACPVCGPRIQIKDNKGNLVSDNNNWLDFVWKTLRKGEILALKSLGGFHLVCDARNEEAINTLRLRKARKAKPFAVMCKDMKTVRKFCVVNKDETRFLTSPQAPIVILKKKRYFSLPETLAPGLTTLGVMLPYTPLHMLLFSGLFNILVMTSGNYSELPLVKDNENAIDELRDIADYYLLHNRDIVNRCDDSLIQVIDGGVSFFRRSRGFTPQPIPIMREKDSPVVLGIGGEMKNSFCILKQNQAFMSQYIGEMDTVEGEKNLLDSLSNFQRLIGVEPEIVACDAHPDYASSAIARKISAKNHVEVQHHHAHFASCMAENNINNEECIGIILDGTGYGTDGNIWGFEVFTGNYLGFERIYHLAYVPLPGGERAIRQPWRTSCSYLITCLKSKGKYYAEILFPDQHIDMIEQMTAKGFNSPLSSGCGRLFDAVSAVLGVCHENTYEGQAAIELGEFALRARKSTLKTSYAYTITGDIISPREMLEGIAEDKLAGIPVETISAKFHNTLVNIICDAAGRISACTGLKKVILSGGTWHNEYLFRTAIKALRMAGFQVCFHRHVPTNDGGIALGQAMIAHWKWKNGKIEEDVLKRN